MSEQSKKQSNSDEKSKIEKLTFEQTISQLETLIEQIESGEIGLEESLAHYENGSKLIKHCKAILETSYQRIKELTADGDGGLKENDAMDD